jgi:Fe2+ or Zn2+ uptake regulation protein
MTQRHSKKRAEILETMQNTHGAITAAELHTKLPHLDLTTIYRNLERFVNEGTVKKLHLTGNEAVFEYQDTPHHHAVCTDCNEVLHFTAKTDALVKALDLPDFDIDEIEVIVRGRHK